MYKLLLGLLYISSIYALHNQPQDQYTFSTSESQQYGILRRYSIVGGVEDAQVVLDKAMEDDLDVWQIAPDHIDIYFPPESQSPNLLGWSNQLSSYLIPIPPPSPSSLSHSLEFPNNWTSLPPLTSPYHGAYHPLFEIDAFIAQLELEDKGGLVSAKRVKVGMSGEGREIWGLRISSTLEEREREHDWEKGMKTFGFGEEPVEELDLGDRKRDTHDYDPSEDIGFEYATAEECDWEVEVLNEDGTISWEPIFHESKSKGISATAKNKRKGVVKKGFLITGAQHAREWIATSTALYLAHALTTHATTPGSLGKLLDKWDFYIIPAPNPDGYDYTWETDRFWYKNRMKTSPDAKCVGIDMNRNWGYKWRSTVSFLSSTTKPPATDPCSPFYPGSRPFQSPEITHIAAYTESLPNLLAFLDLRSYGQMLSSPFSYTCSKSPKDEENQLEAAMGAARSTLGVYGTKYVVGSLCALFYRAHGNIVDWMYKTAGIKYSYAVHLRDTGTYGFALPPQFIRPVGEETAAMVEYLANFIAKTEK